MTPLALLVSADNFASDVLCRVLPECGIAVERVSDVSTAIHRLQHLKFEALIVDFEEPKCAMEILEEAKRLNSANPPVSVALVQGMAKVRGILSLGAHFVLYKPISEENANAGLRAVSALLKRERRKAYRAPVQAPVELLFPDARKAEGILLDLSETGMDVLTAEAQKPGMLLSFHFRLPDGSLEIHGQGEVAWANSNGQTGVRFLQPSDAVKSQLKQWMNAAVAAHGTRLPEMASPCKLTDLSLGGCYVETDSPFPEGSLVELCLATEDLAIHTEGLVRVTHPGYGMGLEFPSRTQEQRDQVELLISFLRSSPQIMPEMTVSPRGLRADLNQFKTDPSSQAESRDPESMEDPLLELLRQGSEMQQDDFLAELRRQRSGESVAN
jgi:CheY-like chemotaxis protein